MKPMGARTKRVGAELVIVVFGVLIALYADGLAERRSDQRALAEHLEAVRDELSAEIANVDALLSVQSEGVEALRTLAALGDLPEAPPDSVVLDAVYAGLLNLDTFEPPLVSLGVLESSGLTTSIRSRALHRAFADVRAALNRAATESAINQQGPQQTVFDPFVLRELPFVWEEIAGTASADRAGSYDWTPLTSPAGRGVIGMRIDLTQATAGAWLDLRERLETALALVRQEIEEL